MSETRNAANSEVEDNRHNLLGSRDAPDYSFLRLCGRGGIGRRNGLRPLSARGETRDVELLKVGETFNMAIPSQARKAKLSGKV